MSTYLFIQVVGFCISAGDLAGDSKLYYINIDMFNTAHHTAVVQYSEFEDVKEKRVSYMQQVTTLPNPEKYWITSG